MHVFIYSLITVTLLIDQSTFILDQHDTYDTLKSKLIMHVQENEATRSHTPYWKSLNLYSSLQISSIEELNFSKKKKKKKEIPVKSISVCLMYGLGPMHEKIAGATTTATN